MALSLAVCIGWKNAKGGYADYHPHRGHPEGPVAYLLNTRSAIFSYCERCMALQIYFSHYKPRPSFIRLNLMVIRVQQNQCYPIITLEDVTEIWEGNSPYSAYFSIFAIRIQAVQIGDGLFFPYKFGSHGGGKGTVIGLRDIRCFRALEKSQKRILGQNSLRG